MKNRILCVLLSVVFTVAPILGQGVMADVEKQEFSASFETFKSNADGNVAPDGFAIGGAKAPTLSDTTYSGFFAVKTDKGTSVNIEQTNKNYPGLVYIPARSYTGSVEFNLSFYLNDFNILRRLYVKGKDSKGNIVSADGETFFDLTNTGLFQPFTDTNGYHINIKEWYTVKIFFNMETSLTVIELYDENDTRVHKSCGIQPKSYAELTGFEFATRGGTLIAGSKASMYVDNIMLRKISRYNYPVSVENNFDTYVSNVNGTLSPTGCTVTGVVAGSNGIWAMDDPQGGKVAKLATKQPGVCGLEFDAGTNILGEYAYIADITFGDTDTQKFFGLGKEKPILYFDETTGAIRLGENEIGNYEVGKKYHITVKLNTLNSNVNVIIDDGAEEIKADTEVNSAMFPFNKIGFYISGNATSSEVLIDNLKVYAVNDFDCTKITPCDTDGNVKINDTINIEISNPVESWESVVLSGSEIDNGKISLFNGNMLSLDIASDLLYDTDYSLSIIGLKDIFGNKKDFTIDFKTVQRVKIGSLVLTKEDDMAKSRIQVSVNDGNLYKGYLILAGFDSDGVMKNINIGNISLYDGKATANCEIPIITDGFEECYFWKTDENVLYPEAEKAVLGTSVKNQFETDSDNISFASDRDTEEIKFTHPELSEGKISLLIVKHGAQLGDVFSLPYDGICHIKQFDESYSENGYEFKLNGIYGNFDAFILNNSDRTLATIQNAFSVYSREDIEGVVGSSNESEVNFCDFITANSSILGINIEDYGALSPEEKNLVADSMLHDRTKSFGGKFRNIEEISQSFYGGVIVQCLNNAENSEDTEEIFNKYNSQINVVSDVSYKAFAKLSDICKRDVYGSISKVNNYMYINDVIDAFRESTLLAYAKNVENNIDIKNLINDNNSWMGWDLSQFKLLNNPVPVYNAVSGKNFDSIREMKIAFDNAVSSEKKAENKTSPGSGNGSSVGGSSGGEVSATTTKAFEFENKKFLFKDMGNFLWAEKAVSTLAEKGIIAGRSTYEFSPASEITREEFVKLIVLAKGMGIKESNTCFTDVNSVIWYAPYICSAYNAGIINGVGNGKFGIGEYLTRQDMAVICAKAFGISEGDSNIDFVDKSEVSDYSKGYINALCKKNIIYGKDNNRFAPKDFLNRAEAAVVICRLLGN